VTDDDDHWAGHALNLNPDTPTPAILAAFVRHLERTSAKRERRSALEMVLRAPAVDFDDLGPPRSGRSSRARCCRLRPGPRGERVVFTPILSDLQPEESR
jgi:hypothetical protein